LIEDLSSLVGTRRRMMNISRKTMYGLSWTMLIIIEVCMSEILQDNLYFFILQEGFDFWLSTLVRWCIYTCLYLDNELQLCFRRLSCILPSIVWIVLRCIPLHDFSSSGAFRLFSACLFLCRRSSPTTLLFFSSLHGGGSVVSSFLSISEWSSSSLVFFLFLVVQRQPNGIVLFFSACFRVLGSSVW
jgi:hypothetical protein